MHEGCSRPDDLGMQAPLAYVDPLYNTTILDTYKVPVQSYMMRPYCRSDLTLAHSAFRAPPNRCLDHGWHAYGARRWREQCHLVAQGGYAQTPNLDYAKFLCFAYYYNAPKA